MNIKEEKITVVTRKNQDKREMSFCDISLK